jgi:putative ABC transport system permease protein
LRALGFGSAAVVGSVLVEAAALAAAGGTIGALTAWLFDGFAVSTLNFQSTGQVAFAFAVTPPLVTQAMAYAVGVGLTGAIWPAWRAAQLPVAAGLRE